MLIKLKITFRENVRTHYNATMEFMGVRYVLSLRSTMVITSIGRFITPASLEEASDMSERVCKAAQTGVPVDFAHLCTFVECDEDPASDLELKHCLQEIRQSSDTSFID